MPNTLAGNAEDGLWESLPELLLIHVFQYLNATDLCRCCQVCGQWLRVSRDELLWRDLLYTYWKVDRKIPLRPGQSSWFEEYKRLFDHVPCYETEVLQQHNDQVLHVSFSHNGKYFATSSKDGWIKVWTTGYPTSVKYQEDMKEYTWKYTQYTQFNTTDTLLLVSGVHFGSHSTSGEVAVFDVTDGFQLLCRVNNKPYDIFGTWYNDSHLLSGNLHWVANLSSSSVLWLSKATKELSIDWTNPAGMEMKIYRFLNVNASSIRTISVSNCPDGETSERVPIHDRKRKVSDSEHTAQKHGQKCASDSDSDEYGDLAEERERLTSPTQCTSQGNADPFDDSVPVGASGDITAEERGEDTQQTVYGTKSHTTHTTNKSLQKNIERCSSEALNVVSSDSKVANGSQEVKNNQETISSILEVTSAEVSDMAGKGAENPSGEHTACSDCPQTESAAFEAVCESHSSRKEPDKYLIFTTGSMTYTPHQIGIKRIKHEEAIGKMEKLSREREQQLTLQRQREKHSQQSSRSDSGADYSSDDGEGSDGPGDDFQLLHREEDDGGQMDTIDHLIEMNGHIIGMQLTPCQRYLYVNTRAWPTNYQIENPLEPPPIAQQIEIHVLDLLTLQDMGVMHFAHKAYTPNDECFFIFLDVCNEYVASGAEDKFAYLWDRHYRTLLSKYPHTDVVNSVAFHPSDPETMVTVSDDYKVKIWRSRNRCREMDIEVGGLTRCQDVTRHGSKRRPAVEQTPDTDNAAAEGEQQQPEAEGQQLFVEDQQAVEDNNAEGNGQ